jgi:hypothetical protein
MRYRGENFVENSVNEGCRGWNLENIAGDSLKQRAMQLQPSVPSRHRSLSNPSIHHQSTSRGDNACYSWELTPDTKQTGLGMACSASAKTALSLSLPPSSGSLQVQRPPAGHGQLSQLAPDWVWALVQAQLAVPRRRRAMMACIHIPPRSRRHEATEAPATCRTRVSVDQLLSEIHRMFYEKAHQAGIAQLGERQTEDLKVACSIHAHRIVTYSFLFFATHHSFRIDFSIQFSLFSSGAHTQQILMCWHRRQLHPVLLPCALTPADPPLTSPHLLPGCPSLQQQQLLQALQSSPCLPRAPESFLLSYPCICIHRPATSKSHKHTVDSTCTLEQHAKEATQGSGPWRREYLGLELM